MTNIEIYQDIKEEMEAQDKKWGGDRELHKHTWLTVLMEEVGEVARAVLEHDDENYKEELTQVGALVFQMLKQE